VSTTNLALPCAALLIIVVCSVYQTSHVAKREEKKVVEEKDGRCHCIMMYVVVMVLLDRATSVAV
jgi:hypothetical protein